MYTLIRWDAGQGSLEAGTLWSAAASYVNKLLNYERSATARRRYLMAASLDVVVETRLLKAGSGSGS